jgi:uncharacterized protein YegJ (DUF2314 family)
VKLLDDPKSGVLRVEFGGDPSQSEGERMEIALKALFGGRDEAQGIKHTEALLATSRAARERAIRELKPRLQKGLGANELLLLKAPFPCKDSTEWMWVEAHSWKGGIVRGTLESDPECAPGLHVGQTVEVREGDIFDYMDEFADGTFVGNDTAKLMRPDLFEELDGGRLRIHH